MNSKQISSFSLKTIFFFSLGYCVCGNIQAEESLKIPSLDIPHPLSVPVPPLLEPVSTDTLENSFLNYFEPELSSQTQPLSPDLKTTESPSLAPSPSITPAEQKEGLEIPEKPVLNIPPQEIEDIIAEPFKEEHEANKPDIYLGNFLNPWEYGDPDETIQLEFENADLTYFISYIEKRFSLTFILDDTIKPMPQGGKSVLGSKISFRTQVPLSKKETWNIFVYLLDTAGLALQPGPGERIYRITTTDPKSPLSINRSPLPTFIGVSPDLIPNNDIRIRYVYFVANTSLDVIKNVIDSMRSSTSAPLIIFPELRGVVITDKASNVRAMLDIINELDKVNLPESLAVIKLKHTDAVKVAELYRTLMQADQQQNSPRLLPRKTSSLTLFEGIRAIIPEPRQNFLIILGTRDAIKKVEDFIVRDIDRQDDRQFAPLHVIQLKYVEAEAVAAILQEAVQFQPETDAARFGGVRNGDKYFKPLYITAEKTGNRLIINAEYEDYLKIFELILKIDIEQPQVGIKVLILNIDITEDKQFGVQLRNSVPGPGLNGLLGPNVNFQTSGLSQGVLGQNSSVVEDPTGTGATRLLGDLIRLISMDTTPGSTLLTLGSDRFGVWGLLRIFEQNQRLTVVANPFLVTTHKYPAIVSFGETRRVLTATTFVSGGPQNSFANLSANLQVNIEPQISYEGLITLQVRVLIEQFTLNISDNGNRTKREIKTSVLLPDNGILALGGLVRNEISENETKVPILGDMPVIGWIFKNKTKVIRKSSLLILISAEIIPPYSEEFANGFTRQKIQEGKRILQETHVPYENRDPLHRWFFKDPQTHEDVIFDQFTSEQGRYIAESQLPSLIKEKQKVSKRERKKNVRQRNKVKTAPQGVL